MNQRSRFYTIIISFVLAFQPMLATTQQGIYHTIEDQHIRAFPPENNHWNENSFYKFVIRYFSEQQKPTIRKKRELGFSLLKSTTKLPTRNTVLDQSSWEDLSLFYNRSGAEHCLAEIINRAETEIGRISLYRMLAEPCADIPQLKRRQAILRELIENEELFTTLNKAVQQVKKHENLVLAFWDNDAFVGSSRQLYFEIDAVRHFNNYEYALDLKGVSDQGQRLTFLATNIAAAAILPAYTVAKILNLPLGTNFNSFSKRLMGISGPVTAFGAMIENKWIQATVSIGSAVCCGLWATGIYDWQRGSLAMSKVLGVRMQHTAAYMGALKQIGLYANGNAVLKQLPAINQLNHFFHPSTPHMQNVKKLLALLSGSRLAHTGSIFSSGGKVLVAYRLMNEHKDKLLPAITAFGELDAYLAIAKLYKEFTAKKVSFTFTKYLETDRPYIRLSNFWNPFISTDTVVANTIELGGSQRNNVIITGPNAGGKSTILKGIAISLIMSQSFGIAPAEEAVITPFTKIATYLNITDDIVAGHSLFKAEVLRAHDLLQTVEQLGPKQFSFVILDEIFNGTSPREGEAAAFATAKHLGTFDRSIAIVATHFGLLTRLEEVSTTFNNYRVRANKRPDGSLHYPFIIERGISDQNVAMDVLRIEGFKSEILEEAAKILQNSSKRLP